MYLKSIEIHGFKSFANKMVFEFQDGITAIVGPNGSGKSNVSDAVRWVLGEQSARQLRGAKMEDVIFAGTENRRPLGFAYVAITLDNGDHKLPSSYEEITVARRVYRSGESEYLINGSQCRLKDVQELFMDTGIGKEGYSIIGQGQIERILSGKPEERRELFDEAAGIVKYKRRKASAEKNLEAERQNLCRIRDIIAELELQIVPLEKQSEKAKQYLKYKEELKILDVDLFYREFSQLKESIDEMEKRELIISENLSDTKISFEDMSAEYQELEQEINQKTQVLEQDKNIVHHLGIEKEQYEGKIRVLLEQVNGIEQNEIFRQERYKKLSCQVKEKEDSLQLQLKRLEEIRNVLSDKKKLAEEKEIYRIQAEKAIEEMTKSVSAFNQKQLDMMNISMSYNTKKQHFITMQQQCNLKRAELNQRLLKVKSSESVYAETIEKETQNQKQIQEQVSGCRNQNEEIESKVIGLDNKILAGKTKLQTIIQQSNMEKAKLASLKNMTERYDGYGQSIKRIMELKPKEPGIIGVVADIIKVKAEYETAIEIALGGSIQNIVTDNENTAKKLIGYLKKNKYGRGTFLPISRMDAQNKFFYEQALKETGVIGLASSLVKTDPKYQNVIKHLLGRIVVANTIDDALALNAKYKNALRIVTLEGELLNPGGSMSGGAFKNSSSLLSRRREIHELEERLEKFLTQQAALEEKAAALKQEKGEQQEQYRQNTEKIQELELLFHTSKVKLQQAVDGKESLEYDFQAIRKEEGELENQKETWLHSIQELEMQIAGEEAEKKRLEEEAGKVRELLEEKKKQEILLRQEVSSYQIEFSKLEQSEKFGQENKFRLEEEIDSVRKELEDMERTKIDAQLKIQQKRKEVEQLKESIHERLEKAEELKKNIDRIEQEKEEIAGKHKGIFAKRDELSKEIILLEKEHARLAASREKLNEQSEQIRNYMWEEYELTFSSAAAYKTESQAGIGELKKSITGKKQQIKELGEVNVNAVEDYKNLSQRFELLKDQHDDLIKSEAALMKIIQELDIAMQNQFQIKFKEIRMEFHKVFGELFGGGIGNLELIDEDHVLETGIQIIAQPPGKKLQNMMQLSGGEKALTAIALLFAIQNLKPSPFCMLDEIEAALDDANVFRFAHYLHKLTTHTQFIIITHRRGTMEAADVLYGITMQEKGVSALVSVNLIENELEN